MGTKHVLNLDLDDEPLHIVAIHSDLEDYHLVYWLNVTLGLQLRREQDDLEFAQRVFAPWYVFDHEIEFSRYVLLPNQLEQHLSERSDQDLFSAQYSKVYYVLPEFKKADYLLKLEGLFEEDLKEILNKLKGLPEIVMAYALNSQQIKSRTNLIF